MLQSIHDKAKGWFAYLIVGFISVPFMLWGINSYLGGGDKLLAAQVNGEDISLQAFQRALQMQRERMREMFGGNIPAEMLEGQAIKQTVIEGMVRDELLRQFAEAKNFQVSDEQVAKEIRSLPVFQENGSFSAEKYTQLLASRRMDKLAFESDLRYGLRLQQFADGVQESEFLTPAELQKFQQLSSQKREVELATIEIAKILPTLLVEDGDIQAYYDSHKDSFLSEERVKLAYLELNPANVVADMEISEDAVRAFYDNDPERFKTSESRQVSHILVKSREGLSEAELEAKAKAISDRLDAGADFAALASEVSEDKLSSDRGGDLGLVYPGDLDPVIEKVIFDADRGVPSAPVKSAQGFQILLVTDIRPALQKDFESVREAATLELKRREADTRLLGLSEQLLTLTYENPESLEIAADALGLKVQLTDWVSSTSGNGLGQEAKVRDAAFSDDVLKSGRNSDVIELADGKQVVVRVAEHQPATPKPLAEVRDQVQAVLLEERSQSKARELGQVLAAAVAGGEGLKAAADAQAVASFKIAGTYDRSSPDVSPEILQRVFKMSHPAANKPSLDSLQLDNGDFVVIQLNKVVVPDDGTAKVTVEQVKSVLSAANGQRAFDAVYRYMESSAEIKIFNENL